VKELGPKRQSKLLWPFRTSRGNSPSKAAPPKRASSSSSSPSRRASPGGSLSPRPKEDLEETKSLQSISTREESEDGKSWQSTHTRATSGLSTSSEASSGSASVGDFRDDPSLPCDYSWRSERAKFVVEAALPLLKASPRIPLGATGDRFRLHLQRATQHQPFGITFLACETTSSRRLSSIIVAEDLPHLDLYRRDMLLTINKARPVSIHEVRRVLKYAMSIELVLQRDTILHDGLARSTVCCTASSGFLVDSCDGCGGPSLPEEVTFCRPLLSIMPPEILDEQRGEFRLVMHRSSLTQQFSIGFSAEHSRRRQEATVQIAVDQPHLGLKRGDRLVSINGVAPRNANHCRHIYENSMTLVLVMRRATKGVLTLSALVERIDEEPSPEAGGASLEEVLPPEFSQLRRRRGSGCTDTPRACFLGLGEALAACSPVGGHNAPQR